jgi:predicted HTH domain antitoxin
LKFLAELMAQKRSASIDATVREPLKLAIELQRMGGDSFMNLARGHGVSYRQIAEEVAQRLGIKFDQPLENMALAELETQVAEKLIEQYKDKLSRADRQVFDAELKAAAQKEQRVLSRFDVGRSATAALSGTALAGLTGFVLRRRGHGDSGGRPGVGRRNAVGDRGAGVFRAGILDHYAGGVGGRADSPAHGARSPEPGDGPGGASGASV